MRRKRHNSYDRRGRLVGKRHISERPAHVEKRRTVGHWEVDTVIGKGAKDCVTTLVERKTGYALIGKLPDRTKLATSKRLKALIRRAPGRFKTITADNGTEFHDYESVERATGVKFYFATPYHSWERGSNENFNGHVTELVSWQESKPPKRRGGGRLVDNIGNKEDRTGGLIVLRIAYTNEDGSPAGAGVLIVSCRSRRGSAGVDLFEGVIASKGAVMYFSPAPSRPRVSANRTAFHRQAR